MVESNQKHMKPSWATGQTASIRGESIIHNGSFLGGQFSCTPPPPPHAPHNTPSQLPHPSPSFSVDLWAVFAPECCARYHAGTFVSRNYAPAFGRIVWGALFSCVQFFLGVGKREGGGADWPVKFTQLGAARRF